LTSDLTDKNNIKDAVIKHIAIGDKVLPPIVKNPVKQAVKQAVKQPIKKAIKPDVINTKKKSY
jgi:hypothetical protein